jgi:transposase
MLMKTVAKIDPEKEYENAKKLIEAASKQRLERDDAVALDSSVDNLITAARVLMEREERRRGKRKPPTGAKPKGRQKGDERADSKKLPSQKFPDLEVKEEVSQPEHPPICPCCNEPMKESGLFDTSEKLEVIPKKYYILKTKRPKYNCCNCHGSMVNTPASPSIVPTSNYGDSFIIDVSLSKYCDLIPIERYVQIAFREGLEGLPAQSLIGLTHHLANSLMPVYELIKQEVLSATVLLADETTHKMLEGDEIYNWYLWGFFSQIACYFEARNTRSGDVAFEILKESAAEYLMSDGYTGYGKAVRLCKEKLNRTVIEVHCNAHAYRYFEEASNPWKEESELFLKLYGDIYDLEREMMKQQDNLTEVEQLKIREQMLPLFEDIKEQCESQKNKVMEKSGIAKAINYFLNHYDGLTVCTTNIDIPLDNNLSERQLRAPVVGRKTWYGTHSKRGAKTNATLFSIVQSCKLNDVNPRSYFPWIVERILYGEELLSPYGYSKLKDDSG